MTITATPAAMPSRSAAVAGWTLCGFVTAFLLLDAAMKLVPVQPVIDAMGALGWAPEAARPLGLLLFCLAALYAWPRTAVLGALLLTAYLGGAVATHARLGDPLFTHTLFGAYLGAVAWAGLWLREPRVRALLRF
jgi:hypothetical protein